MDGKENQDLSYTEAAKRSVKRHGRKDIPKLARAHSINYPTRLKKAVELIDPESAAVEMPPDEDIHDLSQLREEQRKAVEKTTDALDELFPPKKKPSD